MVEEGALKDPEVSAIFGLHGWPELEVGSVSTRPGPIMGSYDDFKIRIRGKGTHASSPHRGVDPIVIASHIVVSLQTIVARHIDPAESVVVTVGKVEGGTSDNIIPDDATLYGTVRTLSPELRDKVVEQVKIIAHGTAQAFGAAVDIDFHRGYPIVENNLKTTTL